MQKLDMVTNDKQNFETLELQLIFYGPNINNCLPKEIIVYIPGIYQSILVIDQFSNFHSLVLTGKHDCCLWLWC